MATELEILRVVSDRLAAQNLDFMLTGSFALAFYATPRMTRDLDFVVALKESDVGELTAAFEADFYIDAEAARTAIRAEHAFSIMHLASGIKVDLIVRKVAPYRRLEFSRRQAVDLAGIQTWIVSREDLILSKLVWARDGGSELQLRDVRALLDGTADAAYLRDWAAKLGVGELLEKLSS
jgi:hypothetical protein